MVHGFCALVKGVKRVKSRMIDVGGTLFTQRRDVGACVQTGVTYDCIRGTGIVTAPKSPRPAPRRLPQQESCETNRLQYWRSVCFF